MYCQKCGSENSNGARFCRGCGEELAIVSKNNQPQFVSEPMVSTQNIVDTATQKVQASKGTKQVIIAAVVSVVVVIGAVMFFSGGTGSGTSSKQLLSQSQKYYKAGDYDNAMLKFESAEDADYSSEYYMDLCYKVAESWYNDGQYQEALEWYEKINAGKCSFTDIEERVKEAKYGYVKDNFYNYSETTFQYLKLLKQEGYKDSADLYDEIYSWKVEIVSNTSESDTSTDNGTFSTGNYVYFHIRVSGGTPYSKTTWVNYKVSYPSGDSDSGKFSNSFSDGGSSWVRAKSGSKGELTISFYDNTDNFMGKKTVTLI